MKEVNSCKLKGNLSVSRSLHEASQVGDILLESLHTIKASKGVSKQALRVIGLHVSFPRYKIVD